MHRSRISKARLAKKLDHAAVIISHCVSKSRHGALHDRLQLPAIAQHLVKHLRRGKRREPLMLISVRGDLMPARGKRRNLVCHKSSSLDARHRRAEIARVDVEGAFEPMPIQNIRKGKIGGDTVVIAQSNGLVAKAGVSHIKGRICHNDFSSSFCFFYIIKEKRKKINSNSKRCRNKKPKNHKKSPKKHIDFLEKICYNSLTE